MKFDRGTVCFTCGKVNASCPERHDVRVTLLYDSVAEWRAYDAAVLAIHEFEDRKLGEAA